jgi:enoyl-CoA hydratase
VISFEVTGGVAQVVIRSPPVNALTVGDVGALRDIFRSVLSRADISVMLLRADGPGFSAGIDYKEMQGPLGNQILRDSGLGCREALIAIASCPIPVVAAVHGYCMGVGVGIAASCDIILLADDARFGLPEGSWSISHLRRLVPPLKLREMALTGKSLTAQELDRLGNVHRVVRPADLAAEAQQVARALCLQTRSDLLSTKARLNVVDPPDLDQVFAREQEVLWELSAEAAQLGSTDDGRTRGRRRPSPLPPSGPIAAPD